MFRERPAFAVDLLESLGFPIPAFDRAVAAPADLTDVVPTEYRADQVVKLTVDDADVFAVIVEVQLRADERKHYTWPAYVGTLPAAALALMEEFMTATPYRYKSAFAGRYFDVHQLDIWVRRAVTAAKAEDLFD